MIKHTWPSEKPRTEVGVGTTKRRAEIFMHGSAALLLALNHDMGREWQNVIDNADVDPSEGPLAFAMCDLQIAWSELMKDWGTSDYEVRKITFYAKVAALRDAVMREARDVFGDF